MKKILVVLALLVSNILLAQTTLTTATGTSGYVGNVNIQANACATFVVENTNASAIILDAIETYKSAIYPDVPASFTLWYSTTSLSGQPDVSKPVWDSITTTQPLSLTLGYNTIFSGLNFQIPASSIIRFAVQSNNGLCVSGYNAGNCSPSTISGGGVNLILGDAMQSGVFVGWAGAFPAANLSPRWFTGSITFFPATACTGTPVAGTATTSSNQTCLGDLFTLSLDGSTAATGLTYQWDSSANGINWFPMVGATKKTILKTQISTSYYRCKVTCGANTATSSNIQVITPSAVSGNFTINATAPASATNFQTFADAINHISCGINGPVVFTVVTNSGPYDEQVVIPHINGASATNTITIKGNGETLGSANASSTNRAILAINGTDYLTIDSLNIDATQGAYGWGIALSRQANNNTIKNCHIKCSGISQTVNFVGIVLNGSLGTLNTNGDNGNNNIIINNTIDGGYTSIYATGNSVTSSALTTNLLIKNNVLTNMYSSGILATNIVSGLVISGNDISRYGRTSTNSTTGINSGANCAGILIEKNKIHNMFDALPTSIVSFSGISVLGDGRLGQENRVENNMIYNIGGNGNQYGLADYAADTTYFYHNTIVLDNATSTTGATYGFTQSSYAADVQVKNNLIVVTRGGTAQKRAVNFTTATSLLSCENNAFYFAPSAGTDNMFGQIGNITYPAFADWQSANFNAYDQFSKDVDPSFNNSSADDFTPTSSIIDDICPYLGVSKDIMGVSRNPTTPDPGAIEFTAPPCTNPAIAGSVVAPVYVCPNTKIPLTLTGNSYGSGQKYTWERSVNGVDNWNTIRPASANYNATATQVTSYYYRAKVQCGTGIVDSTVPLLITSPGFVSGTYTINAGSPTGGTNFQTFNEAINFISCGINGPVTFNVVPGSGPYNESVYIPAVGGTLPTRKITINGNGNALVWAGTANNKAALTIAGTHNLVIDSLNIDVSTGVAGWGIAVINKADSNIIKRCTINCGITSASSNFIGIAQNGSNTNSNTNTNSNYNQYLNNTIIGGYYGFYMYGNGASSIQNTNNTIQNNTFLDQYASAIYAQYQSNTLKFVNNDISRPTRVNSGYFQTCYFGQGCAGITVAKNRIHNVFDAMSNSTANFIGIAVMSDGSAGKENKVYNNAIFNIGHNGAIYALYDGGADTTYFYHNTVVLDDQGNTGGFTYGYYQSSLVNGVEFRNNIIYITRAGSGFKRCLYIGTTNSNMKINNNVYYLQCGASTNCAVATLGSAVYPTLISWQGANGGLYDGQSQFFDPVFTNPTVLDYVPTNSLVNGIGANVGVTDDINGKARTATPDPGAWEIDVVGCINPPIAGSATSTNITICPSVAFSLGLNGNSVGTGLTYMWQKSADGSTNWTDLSVTAGTTPPKIYSQTATTYYRCAVQCNAGTTVYSSVLKIETPTLISGNFTINNSIPASATNFTSFADALNVISCAGLGGPVTLNVSSNSAPYIEKIYIPQIVGMSSTNTLSIYGNGATIIYNSTDASNKAAVVLDGADYVTIDSLNINVNGTYCWGIMLTNTADNNTIRKCVINTKMADLTNNSIGILLNGSPTALSTNGNSGNNNLFENNVINAGAYGFYLYGNSNNATQNINNQVVNNIINDSYNYGVYANYMSSGLVIKKNDIARYNRTSSGANCAGIYLSTGCAGVTIEKNRIHSMFENQGTSTATFYGIYVAAKGKSAAPNKLINNTVYDINGNGTAYGIYNTAGDSMLAYHNTIAIDDAGGATTAATYGYFQTGNVNGIEFKNNVVSITRSGTGIKRIIYVVNATTNANSIICNNNLLYLNSATGNNNYLGQYVTTNYLTLADWQTANGAIWDQNSKSVDPMYTNINSGNYIPSNATIDDMCPPISGITDDILDYPRLVTTPDVGAYEFGHKAVIVPVTNLTFTGKKLGLANELTWSTSRELNNKGFELQRSSNGVDFKAIQFVSTKATNGNSGSILQYSYVDEQPLANNNYYRLKQIDINGKYSYSNVVVLSSSKLDKFEIVNVYPNPTANNVTVGINATKDDNINIIVTDIVGKTVMMVNKTVAKGSNSFVLNTSTLTKGIYLVKATCSNGCETACTKLIKN